LRLYWFRFSDFCIPFGLSMMCALTICTNLGGAARLHRKLFAGSVATILAVGIAFVFIARWSDGRPRADRVSLPSYPDDPLRTRETYANWKKLCDWIRDNTAPNELFITPASQQTFKWYSHRAEVVCWKDIPQDSASIIEWRKRIEIFYVPQRQYEAGLMAFPESELRRIATAYGAKYLIVPQIQAEIAADRPGFERVYPADPKSKSTYVVYDLKSSKPRE
jgi:hypothetical protein